MFLQIFGYSTTKQKKGYAYSAKEREKAFSHRRVHIPYLVSFVTCSGRVYVTFFLLEESDCSRLGTLPFPLVFGVRKMISVGCFS